MNRSDKTYKAWLNNAYGQEIAAIRMYRMHAKDAHDFPVLQAGLEKHVQASIEHAKLVKEVIVRSGGQTNPVKVVFGDTMGIVLGLTGDVTIDKVIMNNLTDLGAANFEVGAYQTLAAGAETVGDTESVPIFRLILEQEQAMADWLREQVGPTAVEFLSRAQKEKL